MPTPTKAKESNGFAQSATTDNGHRTVSLAESAERRGDSRRIAVEQPIRVRTNAQSPNRFDDEEKTTNASRKGVYFTTKRASYHLGMRVLVTIPYGPEAGNGIEYLAEVVRMQILDPETFGVAVRLLMPTGSTQ